MVCPASSCCRCIRGCSHSGCVFCRGHILCSFCCPYSHCNLLLLHHRRCHSVVRRRHHHCGSYFCRHSCCCCASGIYYHHHQMMPGAVQLPAQQLQAHHSACGSETLSAQVCVQSQRSCHLRQVRSPCLLLLLLQSFQSYGNIH